jgi:hypothetical protein
MSGTISISPESRWSASSWLFDWVVRFVAQEVGDEKVAEQLREVVDENLGWVDLGDFPADTREVIAQTLRQALVPASERLIPESVPNRPEVLEHIRGLSELV